VAFSFSNFWVFQITNTKEIKGLADALGAGDVTVVFKFD
jgi:hypothetical protein